MNPSILASRAPICDPADGLRSLQPRLAVGLRHGALRFSVDERQKLAVAGIAKVQTGDIGHGVLQEAIFLILG
jgi:hypothetical protein